MIADEKSKLTDKDIFASGAYRAYLMDLVEVTTGRYKRKIKKRLSKHLRKMTFYLLLTSYVISAWNASETLLITWMNT